MKSFDKSNRKGSGFFGERGEGGIAGTVLTGALSGFAATVGLIALFAAIMLLTNMDRAYAPLFATLSVSAGAFVSALFVSKRVKIKGVLSGLLTGICYFVIVTAVSLAADGSGFTYNTVFHFVIIVLSAAIGGIIGANGNKKGIKL